MSEYVDMKGGLTHGLLQASWRQLREHSTAFGAFRLHRLAGPLSDGNFHIISVVVAVVISSSIAGLDWSHMCSPLSSPGRGGACMCVWM
jgi:hypothetical protein